MFLHTEPNTGQKHSYHINGRFVVFRASFSNILQKFSVSQNLNPFQFTTNSVMNCWLFLPVRRAVTCCNLHVTGCFKFRGMDAWLAVCFSMDVNNTHYNSVKQGFNLTAAGIVRGWNYSATIFAIFTWLTFLFNGFLMILFIKEKHLRTPFTVYLMNLFCANLNLNCENPLRMLNVMKQERFGDLVLCSIEKYNDWISLAVVLFSHFLIYSQLHLGHTIPAFLEKYHHNEFTVFMVCSPVFIFVNIVIVPRYPLLS